GEILRVGPKSKRVTGLVNDLTAALGSELDILIHVPLAEIRAAGGELLAEAVDRLRRGQVRRTPGFDGEYGVIKVFEPGELDRPATTGEALFDLPAARSTSGSGRRRRGQAAALPGMVESASTRSAYPRPSAPAAVGPDPAAAEPVLVGMEEVGTGLLDQLDAMQRVAASAPGGPLLVVAGPGTGKTRTLTHRIAYLCAELGVRPDECLAITFTRRAADELRTRLAGLLGEAAE